MIATKTAKTWMTCNELEANGWDFKGVCLAHIASDKGQTIVRTNGTDFAVMLLGGPIRGNQPTLKVVKVLPTLDAARGYQFAIHR